jgi:ABC-type multidrug transport system permease subunit
LEKIISTFRNSKFPNFKRWINSEKPFNLMIWVYFAILSIPIIRREMHREETVWKTLDLKLIKLELPSSYYLLFIGVLVMLFITHFNKFFIMYLNKRGKTP